MAERAARIRFRRALSLMAMTLVAPGSAQLAAGGNRRVGLAALRTWLALWVLVLVGTVAVALDRGSDRACEQAERIATHMRVRVRECSVDGWDAVVEVAAEVTSALPAKGEAVAIARAGPAGQGSSASAVRTAPSSAIAPALSSGSLPLPHLGE